MSKKRAANISLGFIKVPPLSTKKTKENPMSSQDIPLGKEEIELTQEKSQES